MGQFLLTLMVVLATATGSVAATTADGFARYQIILERKPFGEPPPEPEKPPPPPAAEAPPWAESYRLYSVAQTEGEPIQASLWDLKNMKTVMVSLGGAAVDGIELLSADIVEEVATLSKDGMSATMELEESAKKPPPKKNPPRGVKPVQKKQNIRQVKKNKVQPKPTQTENRAKQILRARGKGRNNEVVQ